MNIKKLTLTSLFAVLLFISSYFKLPIGPVPVTTQTFFVILIGLLLPVPYAFLATLTNLLLQSIFQSAFQSVTFGFIIGFILCATIISYLKNSMTNWIFYTLIIIIGSLSIYMVGVPYFVLLTAGKYSILHAFSITMTPFIIGDTIKAFVACAIASRLKPLLSFYYE